MIKIYGCSDDLVEIENSTYEEDEIGCFEKDVRIRFIDGTVIRIGFGTGYCNHDMGVWRIDIEKQGTAKQCLTICGNEDGDIYSDIFEIDSEIISHSVIKRKGIR